MTDNAVFENAEGQARGDAASLANIERLYRVEAPHFCAGLVVKSGRVAEAAPILKWALGWKWVDLLVYCAGEGWKMLLILPGGGTFG